MFKTLLFLHILSLLPAFGPGWAAPLIGSMSEKEPMHSPFALKIISVIDSKLSRPSVILVGLTGIGLMISQKLGFKHAWLDVSLALYLIMLLFSTLVQTKWTAGLIEANRVLFSGEGDAEAAPRMYQFIKKLRIGGTFLAVLTVTILVLMIYKPGG